MHGDILARFVNCAGGSRAAGLASFLSPRFFMSLRAGEVCRAFSKSRDDAPCPSLPEEEVAIPSYRGDNAHVLKMAAFLGRHLSSDIVGAYVHGSLASGGETAYSDFDALVIVKDEVVKDEQRLRYAGLRLFEATSVMFELDPLQHHGWFALAESQLAHYPEHYLPAVALSSAKALLPGKGKCLGIRRVRDDERTRSVFRSLAGGIGEWVEGKNFPRNAYQLKVLLSRFMLLPSLYVACRDGEAVSKKESFAAARGDFTAEQWKVMDEVSEIRRAWNVPVSERYRTAVTGPSAFTRWLARRYAPELPAVLRERVSEDLYERMRALTVVMEESPRLSRSLSHSRIRPPKVPASPVSL